MEEFEKIDRNVYPIYNHKWEDPGPVYTDLPPGKGHSTKRAKFAAKHTAARKTHRRLNKKHNH